MASQARRLPDLDALRGLAALTVVLHHNWLLFPRLPGNGFASMDAILDQTPLGVLVHGRPAVVFFFVLSGYVLVHAQMHRRVAWPVFAAQRAARLFPPVLASVALSVLLWHLTWSGPLAGLPSFANATWQQVPTAGGVAQQALLLNTNDANGLDPVLWSLVHEWRIGLLLPLALLFAARPGWLVALGLAASCVALAAGVPVNDTFLGADLLIGLLHTLYFLLPFAVGAAIALAGPIPELGRRERMLALSAVGLGMLGSGLDLASVGAAAVLVVLGAQPGGIAGWLRWGPVQWLGRVSFSLYLVHLPVLSAVLHLGQGHLPLPLLMAIALPLYLGAAALMHAACEVPAQRLARRLGRIEAPHRPAPARPAPARQVSPRHAPAHHAVAR